MSNKPRVESYTRLQKGIGQRITWARELCGVSQSALARMLEVDQSTINKIENGVRAPNVFYIIGIANRLRVTTDYILRGLLKSETDMELAVKLAALHPELAHRLLRMDEGKGTNRGVGKHPQPTKPALAG